MFERATKARTKAAVTLTTIIRAGEATKRQNSARQILVAINSLSRTRTGWRLPDLFLKRIDGIPVEHYQWLVKNELHLYGVPK